MSYRKDQEYLEEVFNQRESDERELAPPHYPPPTYTQSQSSRAFKDGTKINSHDSSSASSSFSGDSESESGNNNDVKRGTRKERRELRQQYRLIRKENRLDRRQARLNYRSERKQLKLDYLKVLKDLAIGKFNTKGKGKERE